MTDEEKRVDKEIQSHLKKVYGFSDEQLLKEVESAEKSVNDLDFSGVEDRIYKRIMERRAEKEKRTESVKNASVGEPIVPIELVDPERPADPVESITPARPDEENTSKENSPEKKAVRFRKKTFFLVAAVAAVLAMMLGSTVIGEKNYFLRRVGDGVNYMVAIDNDQNKTDISSIEDAYKDIDEKLGIQVLALGYLPQNMQFEEIVITNNKALIVFEYNDNKIHFVQEYKDKRTSIGPQSDRVEKSNEIYNEWIKQFIYISENILDENQIEYSVEITIGKSQYKIMGIMEKIEFENIVKNLYFFQ